jgi:hypothetical protein
MAVNRMGEASFTDVDTDGTTFADEVNAIWTPLVEETLNIGPEGGWRFSRRKYHGIDDDSTAITLIAQNGTDITVTANAHGLIAGDMVELDGDTGYDGTYDVNSATTNTFDVTATFVATGTGTAHWRSEEFAYRYAKPTSIAVTKVSVGGIELTDWTEQGEYILTNQEGTEVDMDYIPTLANLTVTNFPPHFVDVLWRKISVHLAYMRIQNKAIGDGWLTELEQIYLPRVYVEESNTSWTDAGRTTTILR